MPPKIQMIGKKFGKLTVIEEVEKGNRGPRYKCICDCGNEKIAYGVDLRTLHCTSCGCNISNRAKTHGMSDTRVNRIYRNMKKRCDNPNCPDYHNYGGRGIKYCKEWSTFEGFWEDMKEGYSDKLTLDRIDNDKGYSKENCRWVTRKIQARNTRANRYIEYKGQRKTVADWADEYEIDKMKVIQRLNAGYSVHDALNMPNRGTDEWFEYLGKKRRKKK